MKILFVSMPSIHVIRWIENLKETQHELYWFDVLGRGKLETLEGVKQFTNWKHRKLPYFKGLIKVSAKPTIIVELLKFKGTPSFKDKYLIIDFTITLTFFLPKLIHIYP